MLNNRRASRTTPTDQRAGSVHDRLFHPLRGEVVAAFNHRIYRTAARFVKKRLPTPFLDLIARFYQRKKAKTHRVVAIKAVAHKLARACYYVMRDQVPFDVGRAFA